MKLKYSLLSAALAFGLASGIAGAKALTIGMSIDDLRLERWLMPDAQNGKQGQAK